MRNLEGRDLMEGDEAYVMCIRRAQLDAMAGKSHRTIESHRGEVVANVRRCKTIRKTPSYAPRGPFPLDDPIGMGLVVDMLLKSLLATGRIKDYVQFDTLRKMRSTFARNYSSSPHGAGEGSSFAQGTGRVRPTSCPSQSDWIQDSLRGMEYRMGFESKVDHGISIDAILECLRRIRDAAEHADSDEEENELWKIGAFICMVTACSLRGYEGYYADLAGLRANLDAGRDGVIPRGLNKATILSEEVCKRLPHVTICLLGNFKGEGGINLHVINVASESQSGLDTRWWIEKLVEVCESEGRTVGPAFATPTGDLATPGDYDSVFRKYLTEVQACTDLIDKKVDVDVYFSLNRTPRRSALTRFKQAGLDPKLQEEMNRWRIVEKAKTRRPRFNMRQHYSEACLLMPVTWLCSYAL